MAHIRIESPCRIPLRFLEPESALWYGLLYSRVSAEEENGPGGTRTHVLLTASNLALSGVAT